MATNTMFGAIRYAVWRVRRVYVGFAGSQLAAGFSRAGAALAAAVFGPVAVTQPAAGAGVAFGVNRVSAVTDRLPRRDPEQWFTRAEYPKAWWHREEAALSPEKLVAPDASSSHPGLLDTQRHTHGFVAAITTAFDGHRPLVLRPEHFWTLVLQAVAKHVNANAKSLRKQLVLHEGKAALVLRRDGFVLGAAGNDWVGVVEEFSEQIAASVTAGTAEALATDFSTTTLDERIAGQVVVMDMVQDFFEYRMLTKCGFPKITLEGSSEDWHALASKTEALVRGKCLPEFADRWLPAILPVLTKMAAQYDVPGSVDVCFWQSMCKRGGAKGSGGYTWLNGWFNVFFPTLKRNAPNTYCVPYSATAGYARENASVENHYCMFSPIPAGVAGPRIGQIPGGLASAPVAWDYYGQTIALEFRAGFVGAAQRDDADGAITPEVGWFILNKTSTSTHTKTARPAQAGGDGGGAAIGDRHSEAAAAAV